MRFSKKLFPLLSLEMAMVSLICLFFYSGGDLSGSCMSSLSFLFLILMVLDSVLGISLLILCTRISAKSLPSLY